MLSEHDSHILELCFDTVISERVNASVLSKELEAVYKGEQGDYETALRILNEIIAENPKYASAFNNRSIVYSLMGKKELALQDLQNVLKYGDRNLKKKANEQICLITGELNPYAKMCNEMVAKVMTDYKESQI